MRPLAEDHIGLDHQRASAASDSGGAAYNADFAKEKAALSVSAIFCPDCAQKRLFEGDFGFKPVVNGWRKLRQAFLDEFGCQSQCLTLLDLHALVQLPQRSALTGKLSVADCRDEFTDCTVVDHGHKGWLDGPGCAHDRAH